MSMKQLGTRIINNEVTLSKSSWKLYKACPFKWKLTYIEKFPRQPINKWMREGLDFHDFGEHFYDVIQPEILDSQMSINEIENWVIGHGLENPYMRNYLLWNQIRYRENSDPKMFFPIAREWEFDINGKCGYVDDIYIITKHDEIRSYIPWEIKPQYPKHYITGKKDLEELKDELFFYTTSIEDAQEADRFYRKNGQRMPHQPISHIGGCFYKHALDLYDFCQPIGGETTIGKTNAKRLIAVKKDIDAVKKQILNQEFPAKKNAWCKYCHMKIECPFEK